MLQVLLEDSLGERVWVDRADCKMFVQNVQSAFNTKFRSTTSSDTKADQPVSAGMRCQGYHAVVEMTGTSGICFVNFRDVDFVNGIFMLNSYVIPLKSNIYNLHKFNFQEQLVSISSLIMSTFYFRHNL